MDKTTYMVKPHSTASYKNRVKQFWLSNVVGEVKYLPNEDSWLTAFEEVNPEAESESALFLRGHTSVEPHRKFVERQVIVVPENCTTFASR